MRQGEERSAKSQAEALRAQRVHLWERFIPLHWPRLRLRFSVAPFALHRFGPLPTIRPPRAHRNERGRLRPKEEWMSQPTSLVRRLLLALVGGVCDRPRLVLALSLALCLASAAASALRLEYHTSRNDLISARKDYQQRWQKYLAEFGEDDDVVVVVQGADREAMKRALDAVALRLGERPELFDRVFYKVDLRHLRNRALMLAPFDQLRTIHDDHL